MGKLIFVEGLQGCGKTTISRYLFDAITGCKRECILFTEDARDAVGMPYGPERYGTPSNFMSIAIKRWAAFAAETSLKSQIVLMEGRFLMGTIFSLLRHDLPVQTLKAFILETAAAVSALRPVLVYLYAPDYPPVFAAMCQRRGKRTEQIYIERNDQSAYAKSRAVRGYEGLTHFWLEQKRITEDLVAELDMPKALIDISSRQWDTLRAEITTFLVPHLG